MADDWYDAPFLGPPPIPGTAVAAGPWPEGPAVLPDFGADDEVPPAFPDLDPGAPQLVAALNAGLADSGDPLPCAHYAEPPPRVDLARADSQAASPLLSLHEDVFALLAGFLGPRCSVLHTTWQPTALFSTCKALAAVGRLTYARVEFLLGNFGHAGTVLGLGDWLSIASVDVFNAVVRRICAVRSDSEGKEDNTTRTLVPRYQLQRLLRRFLAAERLDLMAAASSALAELYPIPVPVPGAFSSFGPAGSFELNAAPLTDDELFRFLSRSRRVPAYATYLVREGLGKPWMVPEDAALTAMLTLRHKYGLPAAVGPGASSRIVRNVGRMGMSQRIPWRFTGTESLLLHDILVDVVDANHALLVQHIADGDNRAATRLMACGVGTAFDTDTWFWRAIRAANLLDENEAEELDSHVDPRSYSASGLPAVARILGTPRTPVDVFQHHNPPTLVPRRLPIVDIVRALFKRFGLETSYPTVSEALDARLVPERHRHPFRRPIGHLILDAVEAAVRSSRCSLDFVREMLASEQALGGLDSPQRQQMLLRSLKATRTHIDRNRLIRSYVVAVDEADTLSLELFGALNAGDLERAEQLAQNGARIDREQLLSLLKSRVRSSVMRWAITAVPLDLGAVCDTITAMLPARCVEAWPQNNPQHRHPGVELLLRGYRAYWSSEAGNAALLRLFSAHDKPCLRRLLRPHLGPSEGLDPTNSIAIYDLGIAIRSNQVDRAREMMERGVRIAPDYLVRRVFSRGLRDFQESAILAITMHHQLDGYHLDWVLQKSLLDDAATVSRHLLDLAAPSAPTVSVYAVSVCLDTRRPRFFREVLQRAYSSGAADHRELRRVARRCQRAGGDFLVQFRDFVRANDLPDNLLVAAPIAEGGQLAQVVVADVDDSEAEDD